MTLSRLGWKGLVLLAAVLAIGTGGIGIVYESTWDGPMCHGPDPKVVSRR